MSVYTIILWQWLLSAPTLGFLKLERNPLMHVTRPAPGLPDKRDKVRELVDAFLSGRNERTIEAYNADLADFAAYLGAVDPWGTALPGSCSP